MAGLISQTILTIKKILNTVNLRYHKLLTQSAVNKDFHDQNRITSLIRYMSYIYFNTQYFQHLNVKHNSSLNDNCKSLHHILLTATGLEPGAT